MIYGPDSDAQIVFQAAEQLQRHGIVAPYGTVKPLAPLLIAAFTSMTGISVEQAYMVVTSLMWIGGVVAVYGIMRQFGTSVALARVAATLFAIAPSRVLAVLDIPDESRLYAGTLVVVLVWLWISRVPIGLVRTAIFIPVALAFSLTAPWPIGWLDLLAATELVVVLNLPRLKWISKGLSRRVLVILCFSLTATPSLWRLFVYPAFIHTPQSLPSSVMTWIAETSPMARVYGPPTLETQTIENWSPIDRVIKEQGNENLSVRWLRALGTEYFVSRDRVKFHSRLECVYEESEWCVYTISGSNPAHAVLASRYGRPHLLPLRGVLDVDGLLAYEAWALRAEAAGFFRLQDGRIGILTDLGPDDVILVRLPFRMGWKARINTGDDPSHKGLTKDVNIQPDPMGFMVLDPSVVGPLRITLEYRPSIAERMGYYEIEFTPFLEGPFPRIYPGGIGHAETFALSPFQPGALISIFGEHFLPGDTRVFFDSTEADVLYAAPHQINTRLPLEFGNGEVAVTVETGDRASYPHTIEVTN
jgi:hypothetical protein